MGLSVTFPPSGLEKLHLMLEWPPHIHEKLRPFFHPLFWVWCSSVRCQRRSRSIAGHLQLVLPCFARKKTQMCSRNVGVRGTFRIRSPGLASELGSSGLGFANDSGHGLSGQICLRLISYGFLKCFLAAGFLVLRADRVRHAVQRCGFQRLLGEIQED